MIGRRATPRRGPLRDEHYLAFLREQGVCVACAAEISLNNPTWTTLQIRRQIRVWNRNQLRCDPAHGPVNGRGSKGPDNEAIPLCRNHHEEQTAIGWPVFENMYRFSREREADIWYKAFQIWELCTGVNPD